MKASIKKVAKRKTVRRTGLPQAAKNAITRLQPDGEAPLWAATGKPVKDNRTRAQIIAEYEQRIAHYGNERFEDGRNFEKNGLKREREQMQMEQFKAVTALLQEASKMMSRAGYMIGKTTGKEGF